MDELLRRLLEMTLYGSIAVAMVLLFRLIFNKVPKKVTCLFWIAAAIRLMCPFNFSTAFGIMNLFKKQAPMVVRNAAPVITHNPAPVDVTAHPIESVGNTKAVITETANPVVTQSTAPVITFPTILCIIWIIGIIAILGCLIYKSIRLQKVIRKGKLNGEVIESNMIDTPFVAGFINPKIVIPSYLDPKEKDYLILHEKVHIKHKDNITRALGLFIVSIHWFNPLVWIAFNLLCNDLEMRVDEEVIDEIGNGIKKDYCLSIVNHAMKNPRYKVYGASFAKKTLSGMEVKMRIKNLIKYKNVPTAVGVLVVIATLGMTTVLSSCATEGKTDETSGSVEETIEAANNTFRMFADEIEEAPDVEVYIPTFADPESDYIMNYGAGPDPLTVTKYDELEQNFLVTPEKYEGTDFYGYASKYSGNEYFYDIHEKYSALGGSFFKEGFITGNVSSDRKIAYVVSTDYYTLLNFVSTYDDDVCVEGSRNIVDEAVTLDNGHEGEKITVEFKVRSENDNPTTLITAYYDSETHIGDVLIETK